MSETVTICEHCGQPIKECQHGCWHHTDERGSMFCVGGRIAEPKATP